MDGVTTELRAGILLGSYPKNWLQTATKDGSKPWGMSSLISTKLFPPFSATTADHLLPLVFISRRRVLPSLLLGVLASPKWMAVWGRGLNLSLKEALTGVENMGWSSKSWDSWDISWTADKSLTLSRKLFGLILFSDFCWVLKKEMSMSSFSPHLNYFLIVECVVTDFILLKPDNDSNAFVSS